MRRLTSFWGLISAYWFSRRWKQAWMLTAVIFVLTTLLSKASVWSATATADFLAALAGFHNGDDGADPAHVLLMAAAVLVAITLGKGAATAARHFVSAELNRHARAWMVRRFDSAILANRRVALDLTSDRAAADRGQRLPDAIDQRVDECTNGLYAGLIGLAMGLWGSVASIWFVSEALLERSRAVGFLDRGAAHLRDAFTAMGLPGVADWVQFQPGIYGTFLLSVGLVLTYVPLMTGVAWLIGRVVEKLTVRRQRHDGAWRGEWNSMLNRVNLMAASDGAQVQRQVNARLYDGLSRVWQKQNGWTATMMLFTETYNFLSTRLLAYLPALPAYIAGSMNFRTFAASSELTAALITDMSFFINVMPAIATLRANSDRLIELAQAVDRVRDRETFYAETGVSSWEFASHAKGPALQLRNLGLHHRGHDSAAFLRLPQLDLWQGDWIYLNGQNGCGKSSLLKAVAGIWAYGSGSISLRTGARMFFAAQEPDLPDRLTLKALITYPDLEAVHDDLSVAEVLSRVGLGRFIPLLDEETFEGKLWRTVFSGGQKQRLVLARILLQKPDVILLDEATSAMDVGAEEEFHMILRERLPNAGILAVLHGDEVPHDPDGVPFYTSVLNIRDGVGLSEPVTGRRLGIVLPMVAE